MEIIGFAIVLLICMGIAKAINAMRGRLTINGAAIFLALAAAFTAWNIYMAWHSDLSSYQVGYAFGRNLAPVILVSTIATYFFFKFRSAKAHELYVKKLREQRAAGEA
ncbi:hypothetical protein [Stenotrophomonas sp.]|uniref:hypothetical protein n=1 Tax=Stenotrophomonas sp. TaxID=69392 RepID=UPI0028B06CCF|nr:hypothetical protein [Stenotrophomonas sp.]